ncbi:MAG TPA: cobalamin B12-binding domain-containing protein [Nocardioidaceae bacterium]|nr:cobalamin B12-binding domain-containing protein [Nocardioidaceae bacterium]
MDGSLRIGELARRTGVSPELLRAWELRYGLLRPARTAGGFRLYTTADENRVRRMRQLIADGLSAAEAARQADAVDEPRPAVEPPVVEGIAAQLRTALDRFDAPAAHAALDRLLASVSLDVVLADVLIPYLRDLGERWAARRASVGQEHFASNLLRGRLLALARDWGSGDGPAVLLACLPGEAHDLGLVIFGLLLSRRGWRVTFLGADTPLDTVEASVRAIRPTVIVLVTIAPDRLVAHADDVRRITALIPTAIAGVVDDDAIRHLGARPLPDDIVDAAGSLTP